MVYCAKIEKNNTISKALSFDFGLFWYTTDFSQAMQESYWTQRYEQGNTGWDVGAATLPLRTYADQLDNKSIKILIPGSGNAYEAYYLHNQGFSNVFVLDISAHPLQAFRQRYPDFPQEHLIHQDFFAHQGTYDLILEQTFFCALSPELRPRYAQHMHHLLVSEGKLVGVLFDAPLYQDHPPYGGNQEEYLPYFTPYFHIRTFERCYNSIGPRQGRELFIRLEKKQA